MKRVLLWLLGLSVWPLPVAAQDWFVSSFGGATLHTSTGFVDLEGATRDRKPVIGITAGRHGERRFGFEAELCWMPGFFERSGDLVRSSHVMTTMGNVMVSLPRWRLGKSVRPYGTIGAGVMSISKTDVADVFDTDDVIPAMNAGGGVVVRMSKRVALRGDLRYFRSSFEEQLPGRPVIGSRFLNYWRPSAGMTFSIR